MDWTVKGAVTPMKNRKQCDSCWAFLTTSFLESDKQFVDCDVDDSGGGGGEVMSQEEWYMHGGQLQLHRNTGHLHDFELHR